MKNNAAVIVKPANGRQSKSGLFLIDGAGIPVCLTPLDKKELDAVFAAMFNCNDLNEEKSPILELTLLDDRAMENLHRESLGCEGPTNILAFPAGTYSALKPNIPGPACRHPLPTGFPGGKDQSVFLGSLALSVDTLHRECFLYGQDAREHCIRLLAHGLAHLLGYDHGPAMWAVTDQFEDAALAVLQKI